MKTQFSTLSKELCPSVQYFSFSKAAPAIRNHIPASSNRSTLSDNVASGIPDGWEPHRRHDGQCGRFGCSKKSLKIPKGQSESVYRRRTDNIMAKRKSTKGQTTIYKAYI